MNIPTRFWHLSYRRQRYYLTDHSDPWQRNPVSSSMVSCLVEAEDVCSLATGVGGYLFIARYVCPKPCWAPLGSSCWAAFTGAGSHWAANDVRGIGDIQQELSQALIKTAYCHGLVTSVGMWHQDWSKLISKARAQIRPETSFCVRNGHWSY